MTLDDNKESIIYFKKIWNAAFDNLLCFTEDEIDLWYKKFGDPLLSTPDYVFHQEPWYWLTYTIIDEFREKKTIINDIECWKMIFDCLYILEEQDLDRIDWDTLRVTCIDIVNDYCEE